MSIQLLDAERIALEALASAPVEIDMDSIEAACAAIVCVNLAKRGFCQHTRLSETLARFTITDAGRQYLDTTGSA
jgi:hypothetical protein